MTSKRYIVGSLACGEYPQALVGTDEEPIPTVLGAGGAGAWWVRAKLAFGVHRGRIREFQSPFSGQECIAREVTDPALVAEVDALNARVRAALDALAEAQRDRQQGLAAIAARCKPARTV